MDKTTSYNTFKKMVDSAEFDFINNVQARFLSDREKVDDKLYYKLKSCINNLQIELKVLHKNLIQITNLNNDAEKQEDDKYFRKSIKDVKIKIQCYKDLVWNIER
jgi:hypothetical protein